MHAAAAGPSALRHCMRRSISKRRFTDGRIMPVSYLMDDGPRRQKEVQIRTPGQLDAPSILFRRANSLEIPSSQGVYSSARIFRRSLLYATRRRGQCFNLTCKACAISLLKVVIMENINFKAKKYISYVYRASLYTYIDEDDAP